MVRPSRRGGVPVLRVGRAAGGNGRGLRPGASRAVASIRPAGQVLLAQMDDAAQKGARRDDRGAGADCPAVLENDPRATAVQIDDQIAGPHLRRCRDRIVRPRNLLRGLAITARGRPGRAGRGPPVPCCGSGCGTGCRPGRFAPPHDAVQRVDLAHTEMPLGQAADRRIART